MFMYSQQTIGKRETTRMRCVGGLSRFFFLPLVLLSTFSLTADFAELQALFVILTPHINP